MLPRVSFHSLRHSHASALIASSLDVVLISRRLGHANPTVTLNKYGRLFKPNDRAAAVQETARPIIGPVIGEVCGQSVDNFSFCSERPFAK